MNWEQEPGTIEPDAFCLLRICGSNVCGEHSCFAYFGS